MIKISDLKRIKKTCFDEIASANRGQRKDIAVLFKPIDASKYQMIMSNGEDYGRMVADFLELSNMPEFQISWLDFLKICDLFEKKISVTVEDNTILVKEDKKKFKCSLFKSEAWKNAFFKFDFDTALKINMDECWILSDFGNMQKFALGQNFLMSTDGSFAGINILKQDFGNDIFLFVNKFPAGTWFFNPDRRIIVSEDKRIACSYKRATGNYPFKGILQISEQPLNNWFKVNCKEFQHFLEQCSKIDEKIIFEFLDNEINIIAVGETSKIQLNIPAEFEHKTTRQELRFMQKYAVEFCKCADADGNLTILFDDSENVYMARAEKENLKIFGMGICVPVRR